MPLRYPKYGETEQLFDPREYLLVRYETFLDFDPVPYPGDSDEQAQDQNDALNTARSGG